MQDKRTEQNAADQVSDTERSGTQDSIAGKPAPAALNNADGTPRVPNGQVESPSVSNLPSAPAPSGVLTEQGAFDEWWKGQLVDESLSSISPIVYKMVAWNGWLARTKLRALDAPDWRAATGETVSCEHVRQGDHRIVRLFMCHACIAQIKEAYIAAGDKP